jgi:sugar O-acyltransferase (sialic acid O-acetyltransferase NeuD family)
MACGQDRQHPEQCEGRRVKQIFFIGGGGHCASCIEVVESTGDWKISGIVDMPEKRGNALLGYPYIGTDADLHDLVREYQNVLVTAGQIVSTDTRRRLFTLARNAGAVFPVIVASTARASGHSTIGEGTILMHGVFVNAGARVGANCIVNTGSIIEHNTIVGDHCHVSTAACVNGDCQIGESVFIGSNAVVHNGVYIPSYCLIAAGSVVRRSIVDVGTYAGNPAKKVK